MKGDKYLDTISGATRELREISHYIQQLSRAFSMTGNSIMSDELLQAAKDIDSAQEAINNAVSTEINERCVQSQADVGETLKLVLGGMLR